MMRLVVPSMLGLALTTLACGGGSDGTADAGALADARRAADAQNAADAAPDAPLPDGPLPVHTTSALTAGFGHTCLLHPSGRVKCWGSGSALGIGVSAHVGDAPGELGGALPYVDLGTDHYAVAISGGSNHTCAILDDHSVKCWGLNNEGQLGLGDIEARGDGPGEMGDALPNVDLGTGRSALELSSGQNFTCALLDDHSVKCWGSNSQGQLGQGDVLARGDAPGEMGDALPAIDLEGLLVSSIATGAYFACATSSVGNLFCWGSSSEGQLGHGSTLRRGDEPGEMGDALVRTNLGEGRTVVTLGVGMFHTCAILDDGSLKCFGAGASGALGYGEPLNPNRGDAAGEMGDALPAVNLGTGRTARGLGLSQSDTCAMLDDGTLKCWGYNFYGQAGQGHARHIGDGPEEMGDALLTVPLPEGRVIAQVQGGGEHMCVRFDDDAVRCWGYNAQGQLGQGSAADLGNEPGEITALVDVLPF